MYGLLTDREHESVRDRFFRVLWIATLIWKLSPYPLEEQDDQLDMLLAEARCTNPDGTPKFPKIKTSKKQSTDKPTESQSENQTENPSENPTENSESFERIKIKMKFPNKKDKKKK
jgi:hypothetical protein